MGDNLNSKTNAQWSSESTRKSTTDEFDINAAGHNIGTYTDTSSNKFIFQVTPVITISGGSQQKTYGDNLNDDQLRGLLSTSATYRDSTGKDVDVTQFGNFKEADYLTYVTSSDGNKTGKDAVAVSSGGADAKATRTDGNEKNPGTDDYKTASDGNRAFYVFNVEEDGAKALNGYDLKTVNGDIEILRKTLTINTDATQTYGKADVTSRTTKDYSTQLVNGDTLDAGDITYTIATDGTYATSKGSKTTAHAGIYENQYLTSDAAVKASDGSDASANYAVTGNGTITVNPANLYLTVGDVFTTYGTAFDTDQYTYKIDEKEGGLVNGDTPDSVLGDQFLSYTNTGAKTDASNDKVKTQNAGTYELQGAASKNLSDYTVHITNGKSTVEKAKLTLTVGNTETTYGTAFDPKTYSYTLAGNTNGDTAEDVEHNKITVTYTNGGEKSDAANDKVKTQDVGSHDLTGTFTLSGDTAQNYEIGTVNAGKAEVTPAEIHLKLNDVSTTYGTAFTDTNTYGYDASKLAMANGDSTEVVTKAIGNGDITYTNTGDATDPDKIAKGAKTQDAGTGYQLTGTTEKTLQNYKVFIDGADATINKATLHLSTDDYKEAYGDAGAVQKDLDSATRVTGGEANGDKLSDLITKITITDTSDALISKDRTNDVGKYLINTKVTNPLDNYDVVQDNEGFITLTPKDIYTEVNGKGSTLNDLTWTVMKDPKDQMVNGDSVEFTYTPGNLISYDNQTFDVNSFINGTQTFDSTTDVLPYGKNYIFHSTGKIQLTFSPIVKPDVWAHSGGYRPRNKIETSLPVFRVEDAKVGQYGTYGVEHNEEGDKLVLSATGMRLPEPDQVPDEERTFTTTLSTETGSGTFKLVYNGVSLKVYPQDKEAEETVRAGDKTKNVSLSEKALYVGYTEMGLDLIDLKGVYIYFN